MHVSHVAEAVRRREGTFTLVELRPCRSGGERVAGAVTAQLTWCRQEGYHDMLVMEVLLLAVGQRHAGAGLGRALLQRALRVLRASGRASTGTGTMRVLTQADDGDGAQGFWRACGLRATAAGERLMQALSAWDSDRHLLYRGVTVMTAGLSTGRAESDAGGSGDA